MVSVVVKYNSTSHGRLEDTSTSSKQVEFMQHAALNTFDPKHHPKDWTFLSQKKSVNAHLELQQTK